MIRYLEQDEIDHDKWDACISESPNGLVYGLSWYLDVISEEWDAIILNDYEAVMPLPWKKKLGFHFIYPPFFAQQLGIFSRTPLNEKVAQTFLNSIPKKFKRIQLYMNSQNDFRLPGFEKQNRPNFELELNLPYEDRVKQFKENTKRNIKKSRNGTLSLFDQSDPETLMKMAREHMVHQLADYQRGDLERLTRLMYQSVHKGIGRILSVTDASNQVLASAFFLFFKGRITYHFPVSTPEGKKKRAMFFLLDEIIRQHSGMNFTLDLEGSSEPNVARFYKGFSAIEKRYYFIEKSNIPSVLKIFLSLRS